MTTLAAETHGAGTIRAERAARTRAGIVAAAHGRFVEQGYRATSLRDVAKAAGISQPGLQRHFPTKADLLVAVVASFHRRTAEFLAQVLVEETGRIDFPEIARRNAEVPGYLELYAALTGEASVPDHPAHGLLQDHYAMTIYGWTHLMDTAIQRDVMSSDRVPRDEAIRLIAAWDGLQLLDQYLPERIDIVACLEAHKRDLALPLGRHHPEDGPGRSESAPLPTFAEFEPSDMGPEIGYRVGRERRRQIVTDATLLFAREGYGDTSLADIAEAVGISKSTLLHHYRSKEDLLRAVLVERDRGSVARSSIGTAPRASEELRMIPATAAEDARSAPGHIGLHAVLSCEAVPAEHPAHDYFVERFRHEINYLAALLALAQADGNLPSHRDPEFEAIWIAALWEGLQYQWLYDHESVDIAAQLTAHLDDILTQD